MSSPVTDETPDPRAAILEATLRVLVHGGPGALKVRAIADAAGCSTTGVYTWFGNKSGLIEAVWRDSFQRFAAALATVHWEGADEIEALSEGLSVYRRWAVANRERYLVMFAHAVADFEPSPAAATEAYATFGVLVDAVARAQGAGRLIAGDSLDLAGHLWASIHGYVMLEFGPAGGPSAFGEAAFRRGVEWLIAGLAPAEPAPTAPTPAG